MAASSAPIAVRQPGFGFGKGRHVVLPWPRRHTPKLRMAKARLR